MKIIKSSLIILLTFIIILLFFFLAKNIKNNNSRSNNNKIFSEINYMDSKISSLLNSLNNITLDNNKINVSKINANISQSSNSSKAESQDKSNNKEKDTSNQTTEQYEIKPEGILTKNNDIKWDEIKDEVEILYSIVPVMTLDLYNMNINQDDVLNFNKELDDLTIAVKNENKDNTLIKLANLYRYLPAYASSFSDDLNFISMLEIKSNIFNAYVFVNIGDWNEALNYTNKSIESYSRVLNNIKENRNYDISKIYIILNELQNAVNIKDKDVFFIKYKNFQEEIEKTDQ